MNFIFNKAKKSDVRKTATNTIEEMENSEAKLLQENEYLNQRVTGQKQALETLDARNKKIEEKNRSLEGIVTRIGEENLELASKIEALEAEKEERKDKAQEIEQLTKKAENKLEDINELYHVRKTELDQVETKYVEQKKKYEEKLNDVLKEEKKLIHEARMQKIELQDSVRKLGLRREDLVKETSAHQTELDTIELSKRQSQSIVTKLKERAENLKEQIFESSTHINDLKKKASHLTSSVKQMEDEKAQKRRELQRLREHFQQATHKYTTKCQALQKSTATLEDQKRMLEQQVNELKKMRSQIDTHNRKVQHNMAQLERRRVQVTREIETKISEYKKEEADNDRCRSQLREFSREIDEKRKLLNEEKIKHNQTLGTITKEKETLKRKMSEHQRYVEQNRAYIDTKKTELSQKESRLDSAQTALNESLRKFENDKLTFSTNRDAVEEKFRKKQAEIQQRLDTTMDKERACEAKRRKIESAATNLRAREEKLQRELEENRALKAQIDHLMSTLTLSDQGINIDAMIEENNKSINFLCKLKSVQETLGHTTRR